MSRLAKFFRLSAAERRLVLETFALLGLARLAVITLPFRTIADFLGEPKKDLENADETALISLSAEIDNIVWALRRVSCHTPWRSNCLAKAVAGRFMLRRRRIANTLYFGMIKNSEGEISAHAWLCSGDTILTGGSNLDRYTIVAKFTN